MNSSCGVAVAPSNATMPAKLAIPNPTHLACNRCGVVQPFTAEHNPDKYARIVRRRNERLKLRKHGLSYEQYEEMLFKQDGRCAICRKPETVRNRLGFLKALHLDHCHTTGRVRGLLCARCNLAVGHVKDSPETCRRMAAYLEAHGR